MDYLSNYVRDSISDDMLWKQPAIEQMNFFLTRISPLFNSKNECSIQNWHFSKSIKLPVYFIETDKIKVIARNNFYNWNCTIIAQKKLLIPNYLTLGFGLANGYKYFEGMSGWEREDYDKNKKEFSFAIFDDYKFFAIMWNIASQIRK